jgi:predicted oxidoreductase
MKKIQLDTNFSLSRIVHGQMRMREWNMNPQQLLAMMKELVELGVTTFDHADIYGGYYCESLLGEVFKLGKGLRDQVEIVTKCGIKVISDRFPDLKVKHYDYSREHILKSAELSLKGFGTDRIDLLLLHRPAPYFDPAEVAEAFTQLKQQGKVLHFGVSNFTPGQFEMLQGFLDMKLVTNQIEVSPYCLEHFENGNMDFFLNSGIHPMAWSPVAGGRLMSPWDGKGPRIMPVIKQVAEELGTDDVEKVIYAWLLKHPTQILPVVGSGKMQRIKSAVAGLNLDMSLEQWYMIYVAALGKELP